MPISKPMGFVSKSNAISHQAVPSAVFKCLETLIKIVRLGPHVGSNQQSRTLAFSPVRFIFSARHSGYHTPSRRYNQIEYGRSESVQTLKCRIKSKNLQFSIDREINPTSHSIRKEDVNTRKQCFATATLLLA